MSHHKNNNGCFTWAGSIFVTTLISVFIAVLFGIIGVTLIVKIVLPQTVQKTVQKEARIQTELEENFKIIQPLSNATLASYKSCTMADPMAKADPMANGNCGGRPYEFYVSVGATYFTNIQPIDIFNYYDKELNEQGWNIKSNETDWNNQPNTTHELTTLWCKGDYSALLQYYRDGYSDKWMYALWMEWNRLDCSSKK